MKVQEDAEPDVFKAKFVGWRDRDASRSYKDHRLLTSAADAQQDSDASPSPSPPVSSSIFLARAGSEPTQPPRPMVTGAFTQTSEQERRDEGKDATPPFALEPNCHSIIFSHWLVLLEAAVTLSVDVAAMTRPGMSPASMPREGFRTRQELVAFVVFSALNSL